ncbi:unnamed protein product, partial [marine sediment metagenome]
GDFWIKINTINSITKSIIGKINKGRTWKLGSTDYMIFKHKYINNLHVFIINDTEDFLRIYYNNYRENVIFGQLTPTSRTFKITNKISTSKLKNCHMHSFYFDSLSESQGKKQFSPYYPHPNPMLSKAINKYIKSSQTSEDWGWWTSYLLSSIINLLVNCFHCKYIDLADLSTYSTKDRNCHVPQILNKVIKDRIPLYQDVGFKSNPPQNIDTLRKIVNIEKNYNSKALDIDQTTPRSSVS